MKWARRTLIDLCERITVGHVGPMASRYTDNGIPFLRSQNISPFRLDLEDVRYIDEGFHAELRKSALAPGDVAVVRTGYPGTAAVIPETLRRANCADLVVITPGPEIDSYYLAALFNSTWGRGQVAGRLVGVAQQHFNVTAAKEMEVPVPPIEVQRTISSMLSAFDDLIANNTRRIQILEDMARAVYREWFVEFRYPGRGGVPLVESELGPIPEGWEVAAFADVADFINGFAFGPDHWGDTGLPIIKIRELKNGVGIDTPRYDGDDIPQKYLVSDGDILFSWSGHLDAYVWNGGNGLLNQHLFNVIPTHDHEKLFLFHSLKRLMGEFVARSGGTTMHHIKRSALKEVSLAMPRPEVQRGFVAVVRPMHDLVLNLNRRNDTLRNTRDLLLPKLVSGEVDVSDLDLGVEVA